MNFVKKKIIKLEIKKFLKKEYNNNLKYVDLLYWKEDYEFESQEIMIRYGNDDFNREVKLVFGEKDGIGFVLGRLSKEMEYVEDEEKNK